MAKVRAWRCPRTGLYLETADPRLLGQGNPPSTPFVKVGYGRLEMELVTVDEAKIDHSEAKQEDFQ